MKKRASSKLVHCPICQKEVFERGLNNHIRLQHKLKTTQVKTEVISYLSKEVETPIKPAKLLKSGGKLTQVTDLSKTYKSTQVIETIYVYQPTLKECDNCCKMVENVKKFSTPNGSYEFYYCKDCFGIKSYNKSVKELDAKSDACLSKDIIRMKELLKNGGSLKSKGKDDGKLPFAYYHP